ncbi:uncharacterized protein MICPUCDRAFT_66967 [Micromonas pusilla CCMP1545]|uniref:Homoserine dehydrogenase n=1 Tax=Micromonas pusilla (strain CCMP1545) TaxID=564608 RepID=C1N597_MICPC|nr:uncharacterized protein MICPUCDRAFT_66967 [Micromonas pusilla CCMP1545]EEH52869.1 predicted protein [Micromonas pusilla CCMP1545]|eukprot:XP_003062930.1 predicted protein [Micromonas pusilla CCMP1545]
MRSAALLARAHPRVHAQASSTSTKTKPAPAKTLSRASMKTVPLHVGFVGTGLIGGVAVKQVASRAGTLLEQTGLDLKLAGATDSKSMILASDPAAGLANDAVTGGADGAVADWNAEALSGEISPCDLDAFAAALRERAEATGAHAVIVDNTSSEAVADRYEGWLASGVHVVTPNKKANSGDLKRFKAIRTAATSSGAKWLCEGTIGAGLPIVSTLRTLRASGDEIRSVQGVFSGTMSFLFNTWDPAGGQPFSEVVLAAKAAGFTEPDPRDDLNGMDVARKVVIAARESGVDLELADVTTRSLVPPSLESCDAAEYVSRMAEFDGDIAKEAADAASRGNVLRFVGKVDVEKGVGSVELGEFPKTHPFAGLQGADNVVEIQSSRYSAVGGSTPLIVRGPGAGAAVTAGGVFGDLCKLGAQLGASVLI